jgi:hypothetical protein
MCPACLTTIALVAAGTGSAGGVAAVLVTKIRRKLAAKDLVQAPRATEPAKEPAKKEEPR